MTTSSGEDKQSTAPLPISEPLASYSKPASSDESSQLIQGLQTLLIDEKSTSSSHLEPAQWQQLADVLSRYDGVNFDDPRTLLRYIAVSLPVPSHQPSTSLLFPLFDAVQRLVGQISQSVAGTSSSQDLHRDCSTLSAALKAYHALIRARSAEGSPLLQIRPADVKESVQLLLRCCHLRPSASVSSSLGPILPPTGQNQEYAGHRRRNSAQSVRSDLSEADTEAGTDVSPVDLALLPEAAARKKLASAGRTVRSNALTCLYALNEVAPAQLFPLWQTLLALPSPLASTSLGQLGMSRSPSSSLATNSILTMINGEPVLSIKLAACHFVENLFSTAQEKGFLAGGIVEQRQGSFGSASTSLSARIGTVIADLRHFVAQLLESSNGSSLVGRAQAQGRSTVLSPALLQALLRLIKALIQATRTVRLRRSHADVLRPSIVALSAHADPNVAIAAYQALSALSTSAPSANRETAGAASVLPANGDTVVPGLLRRLDDSALDADTLCQAWSALGSFASKDSKIVTAHRSEILTRLTFHISADAQVLRQAAVSFLVILLSHRDIESKEAAGSLLHRACGDASPLVRSEAVQGLPDLISLQHGTGTTPESTALDFLTLLCRDPEAVVKAVAIRGIGVLLSASPNPPLPTQMAVDFALTALQTEQSLLQVTSPLCDSALLVRLRASWTLGNLCQALTTLPVCEESLWKCLLSAAIKLSQDDERIALNALRSIGLLLSMAPADWLIQSQSHPAELAVNSLIEATRRFKTPKTKWNAVNALATVVSSLKVRLWLDFAKESVKATDQTTRALATDLIDALSSSLGNKIFKVKLAAIQALLSLQSFPDESMLRRVKEATRQACDKIEEEMSGATFTEFKLHGDDTRKRLVELRTHLETIVVRTADSDL